MIAATSGPIRKFLDFLIWSRFAKQAERGYSDIC